VLFLSLSVLALFSHHPSRDLSLSSCLFFSFSFCPSLFSHSLSHSRCSLSARSLISLFAVVSFLLLLSGFHVGSEIELLFGFTNNGELPLNISVVGAFLHSPYDFTYYIQNVRYTHAHTRICRTHPRTHAHPKVLASKSHTDKKLTMPHSFHDLISNSICFIRTHDHTHPNICTHIHTQTYCF